MGCLCLSCLDFMARVLLALWLVLLICVVSWRLFVFVLLLCMFTLLFVMICCYCLLCLAVWFGGAAWLVGLVG